VLQLCFAVGKPRSPVLGFNHNVRHIGWLFHVQTEDSGVSNPHIFTHLFHEGVILASKKMVYDANSDVDVVKGLMQAQHKSVLRELKSGTYDVKIRQYLGAPPGSGDVGEYDEVTLEAEGAEVKTPPPTPAPAQKPTTVGAVADLNGGDPTRPMPLGSSAAVPSATDVSAAFRAISHASAQMNVARRPGSTTNPPPVAGAPPTTDEVADMVFAAPGAAPPPPGSGVWSAKPEIAQERPFDRTGGFPAMKTDGKGRTIPPPMGEGSDPGAPRGKSAATGRPTGTRPATIPPPSGTQARSGAGTVPPAPGTTPPRSTARITGAPPTNRPTGTQPSVAGAAPRPGTVATPTTNRPAGSPPAGSPAVAGGARNTSPPPVNAPAPRPPMVQGQPARPGAGAAPRPTGSTPGTQPPTRPVPPTRAGTTTSAPPSAPGTQPPGGPPPRGSIPPSSSNVIVARPAVIVGAPPQVVGGSAQPRRSGTGPREAIAVPPSDSIFGKDLISEKSLDEVIMAYLSEDANEE